MNTLLPPLRPWSGTSLHRCTFEEIPRCWEAHDVITFLADRRMYSDTLYHRLEEDEKEQVRAFKSDYFKKRFTVSRYLLKRILHPVLGTNNPSDIRPGKERKGRVVLSGRPDIGISLSYSGPWIAITIGKQKIGSDIEVVRPVLAKKITSHPAFNGSTCTNDKECRVQAIHLWTLLESYAKLSDRNSYSLLNSCSFLTEATFKSWCIDHHSVLSVASGEDQIDDVLVRLDTSDMK